MTLKDAWEQDPMSMVEAFPDQIPMHVIGGSSNLEGKTVETEDMIDPRGGSSRSIFLAKREC